MEERLCDVLKCEKLSDYKIDKPTRTYTYLLNDIGEEFKAKPVLMGMLSDDYESAAAKLNDDNSQKSGESGKSAETTEKKGFFGKLFGKKK